MTAIQSLSAWRPHRVAGVLLATALMLPAGATFALPSGEAALQERIGDLCRRTEFTRSEIRAIQRERDFPAIVIHMLETCPAVAAVLTSGATASTPAGSGPDKDDKARDRPSGPPDKGDTGY